MNRSRSAQFRSLYARYFRAVWAVVGQLGMHGPAREDAVQEIWIIAYRRLHTLEPQASPRAWLSSIARKVVWRMRRNAQRFDRRVNAFADEPRSAPSDASARYEVVATVRAALDSLSEAQRSVLVLTTVHGFTAPEVADALSLPVNTVYSRLRLARRRIAEHEVRSRDLEVELEARDPPPEDLRTRVLSAVLPAIPVAPLSTVGATASTIKAFALGGVVGGLAVAVTVVAAEPSSSGRARSSAPVAVATEARPPVVSEAPASQPSVPAAASVAGPAAPVSVPARRRASPAPQERPATPVATVEEPATPSPSPSVDPETALLARAQRRLRAGQPGKALRLLRQHELQFAQGVLGDVREGAFVRALCALGQPEQASAHAQRLAERRPDSPVATAVEDVCADGDDGTKPPRR